MTEAHIKLGDGTAGEACTSGYEEYDWIDWLTDKTDPPRTGQMRQHLRECRRCSSLCREWSVLLESEHSSSELAEASFGTVRPGPMSSTIAVEPINAAGETESSRLGSRLKAEPEAYPSPTIYHSLATRVKMISWRRRAGRLTVAALPAAACLLLVLWLGSAFQPIERPAAPINDYVQSQEPSALAVLSAPDTARYRVSAPIGGNGTGYIWLSSDNSEAFLLLDRLPVLELSDYQAWAVSGSRRDSLGLLKLAEGRGHLYVQADILRMADTIALSAEPKGGSRQPTTEQFILLLIGRQQ